MSETQKQSDACSRLVEKYELLKAENGKLHQLLMESLAGSHANIDMAIKLQAKTNRYEQAIVKAHDLILTLNPDCQCQQQTCFEAREVLRTALEAK